MLCKCRSGEDPVDLVTISIQEGVAVHVGWGVVLLAPLLWLGWPCAAPPPPLLGVLRPIPFGVGVICDPLLFTFFFQCS